MAKKMLTGKHQTGFTAILALITIMVLIVGALNDYGVIDLNPYVAGMTSLLLGFGLMIEGNIRGMFKFLDKKKIEVPGLIHMVTGILGLIVFIAGVMALTGLTIPPEFLGIVGTAKIVAVVAVVVEFLI